MTTTGTCGRPRWRGRGRGRRARRTGGIASMGGSTGETVLTIPCRCVWGEGGGGWVLICVGGWVGGCVRGRGVMKRGERAHPLAWGRRIFHLH
jgi:hypothetical protein